MENWRYAQNKEYIDTIRDEGRNNRYIEFKILDREKKIQFVFLCVMGKTKIQK